MVIVPAQPAWPAEFRALAAKLHEALGPLARRINHIGSTSDPGLDAKDGIDVQVTVAVLAISLYLAYYNAERPHTALEGLAPLIWLGRRGVTRVYDDHT